MNMLPNPSSQTPKDKAKDQNEPAQAEKKVFGFALGEDLTQPVKPIPGAKLPETEQSKKNANSSKPVKGSKRDWVIYDINKMTVLSFTALAVLGVIGAVLIFYVFNIKMADKYPIKVDMKVKEEKAPAKDKAQVPGKPQEKPKQVQAPAPMKNTYALSPQVSVSLDGIVSADGKNVALIDDQIVEVGDTVKGAQVLSITPNEVVVSFQGKKSTLILK